MTGFTETSRLSTASSPATATTEWLSAKIPRKSPYFPQIGDELVYLRQGHQQYIEFVQKEGLFALFPKISQELPWKVLPNLQPEVPVRLIDLKYEVKPRVLASLKLRRSNEPYVVFNVTYHHVRDIPEFLICRQLYYRSQQNCWRPNDRFRSLINDSWWFGSIVSVKPLSDEFPASNFQSCNIRWDQGYTSTLSPWDIEEIPDVFEIPCGSQTGVIRAHESDIRSRLYEPQEGDWFPEGDQDAESERMSILLTAVMTHGFAVGFVNPVNLNAYPNYTSLVPYPIDLSTIKARLDNRFYRRKEALNFDLRHIAINAEIYNLPRTQIVEQARIVRDLCLLLSNDSRITDVEHEYYRISDEFKWSQEDIDAELRVAQTNSNTQLAQTSSSAGFSPCIASVSNSVQVSGHSNGVSASTRVTGSGTLRHAEGEPNRSWKNRCAEILEKLWNSIDSVPFRAPVDILEIPNYYVVIDTPMDLQSVREDLEGGNYRSAQEFAKDIDLIISNSKKFNRDPLSEIYQMTRRMEEQFETLIRTVPGVKRRSRTQVLRDKHIPPGSPGRATVASNSESDANGQSGRRRLRRIERRHQREPDVHAINSVNASPEQTRETRENIQVHLEGIHETLKEILRLKRLKYASMGFI